MAGDTPWADSTALLSTLSGAGRHTVPAADILALLRLCGWALAPEEEAEAGARAALDRLVAIGLPWGGSAAERRFDPAETINFVKQAGGAAGDLWPRYVATGRALLAQSLGVDPAAPPDLGRLPRRRFTVEIRRSFDGGRLAPDARLRLRLPLPVASPRLRLLAVEPILPDGAEHSLAPGRMEVRLRRPGTLRIDLAVRIGFVAAPGAVDTDDAADPAWLREDGVPIAVTPRIRALAASLAGHLADPGDAVRAFHDHLIDNYTCGVAPYDRLPAAAADWVLDSGWYDCRLAAALLVALCRARGIPARLVGGYLLWRVPTEHYWAEVLIDGRSWTPFDLLGWDLSAGGADPAWRRLFAGATDYRMTTQRLPDIFTGAPGIAPPPAWHRLVRLTPEGAESRIVAIPDGRVVLTEEVIVRADPSEPEG